MKYWSDFYHCFIVRTTDKKCTMVFGYARSGDHHIYFQGYDSIDGALISVADTYENGKCPKEAEDTYFGSGIVHHQDKDEKRRIVRLLLLFNFYQIIHLIFHRKWI